METTIKPDTHPCFNKEAKHKYARVHLPIAPKCNVQCNYCNRKYDCVNESRPGVTSAVLSPYQALNYMRSISAKINNISTIGIAGPGDAFAEPEITLETIQLIKREFPDKLFCISTNGLELEKYIDDLILLDVTHITITLNSFHIDTLVKIYKWVRFNKRIYRGIEAAEILLSQQIKALEILKSKGIKVKINSILIPGVNEHEMEEIAERVASYGVTTMNCIPLIPAEGSVFENNEKPSREMVNEIVKKIANHVTPMTHCARCRADAAGLIGHDHHDVFKLINECTVAPVLVDKTRPHVAVASYEGILINKHLGEALEYYIYKQTENGYVLVEKRPAPSKGQGDVRWLELATILHDCSYILVSGVGKRPVDILQRAGIAVVEMSGLIDNGLDAVFKGEKLKTVLKIKMSKCGDNCKGNGMGCG